RCVRVWDLDRGAVSQRLELSGNVHGVSFSADGKWVVTASQRSEGVALWDVATGRRVDGAPGQTEWPWAGACPPDGTHGAAGGWGKCVFGKLGKMQQWGPGASSLAPPTIFFRRRKARRAFGVPIIAVGGPPAPPGASPHDAPPLLSVATTSRPSGTCPVTHGD